MLVKVELHLLASVHWQLYVVITALSNVNANVKVGISCDEGTESGLIDVHNMPILKEIITAQLPVLF